MPNIEEEFEQEVDPAVLFGGPEAVTEAEPEPEPVVEPETEQAVEVEVKPEPEPEQVAEPEVEPEPKPEDERSQSIPRARFDKVNSKKLELQEENDRLQAELDAARAKVAPVEEPEPEPVAPVEAVNIDELEKKYLEASMDGEDEDAIAIRKQINDEILRKAEESAEKRFEARELKKAEDRATKALKTTAESLISEFPVLDAKTGDPEQISEVIEWRDFYYAKGGIPLAEALEMAARKLLTPAAAPKKEEAVDPRKQKANELNADTANRQPPPLDDGVGNRGLELNDRVPDDQEEYEKLPDAERKKLLK